MAKNGFDTAMFDRQITRTFQEYLRYNKRSRPLLLAQQADKLAFELQQQARAQGPATRSEIAALPRVLNYRIRRRLAGGLSRNLSSRNKSLAATVQRAAIAAGRKHVTIEEENKLRLRWAGFYQASGWITTRGLSFARIRRPRGKVIAQLIGATPVITLINQTPGAGEFATKTGYVARAVAIRQADMERYIRRKVAEEAAEFSRARPNFGRLITT